MNCKRLGTQKRVSVPCAICGKITDKVLSKINHSKSGKFFCDKSCQTIWRNKFFSGDKHTLWKGGVNVHRRIMINSGTARICRLCDVADKRILAVHHLDENHLNNDLKNLAWLCHNCHHLVHCDSLEKGKLGIKVSR